MDDLFDALFGGSAGQFAAQQAVVVSGDLSRAAHEERSKYTRILRETYESLHAMGAYIPDDLAAWNAEEDRKEYAKWQRTKEGIRQYLQNLSVAERSHLRYLMETEYV